MELKRSRDDRKRVRVTIWDLNADAYGGKSQSFTVYDATSDEMKNLIFRAIKKETGV